MRKLLLALIVTACGAAACAANDGTTDVPPGAPAPEEQATPSGGGGTSGSSATSGGGGGGGDEGKGTSSSGGSAGSPTHVGSANIYPNATITPGAVLNVSAATVCQTGYPATVRNVSTAEKAQVFARYGLTDVPGMYEVDHFISLELGGSNDLTNLWPQRYAPAPGAHEKDGIEAYLHAELCDGKMTLAQVQQAITTDWYAVYLASKK